MKLRKKPVVIDGVQWTGNNEDEVKQFIGDFGFIKGAYVEIGTREGLMVASIKDWILKGVKGEFYPCKPDTLDLTYDKVEGIQMSEEEEEGKNEVSKLHDILEPNEER